MSFTVSCTHTDPRWTLVEQKFADTTRGEWGDYRVSETKNDRNETVYYAIAPEFGCGRNAPNKDRAISSLLMASASHSISIRESL